MSLSWVGAVHLDVLGGPGLALHTGTTSLEGHRAGRLDHAERLLAAGLGNPLTRGLAGKGFI